MTRMRVLTALATALIVAGCATQTTSPTTDVPDVVIAGSSGVRTERMDPLEILEARIEGDLLHLQVRYGGGCREHDFSLLFSGAFMESEPVQTRVTLAHDAHGDPCRALVGSRLQFDLGPLRRAYQQQYGRRSGTIVVHVHAPGSSSAAASTVRYSF